MQHSIIVEYYTEFDIFLPETDFVDLIHASSYGLKLYVRLMVKAWLYLKELPALSDAMPIAMYLDKRVS